MNTEKKFGKKILELLDVVDSTKNWEQYVSPQTVDIIKTLKNKNNITEVICELDMKYTTVHAHLIRALTRIQSHNLRFIRDGKSPNAQHLFKLMKNEKWKEPLTDKEIKIAESFYKHKNFYICSKEVGTAPSNISAILYGNNQKKGVIKKIESYLNIYNPKSVTIIVEK